MQVILPGILSPRAQNAGRLFAGPFFIRMDLPRSSRTAMAFMIAMGLAQYQTSSFAFYDELSGGARGSIK